ncbi:carboxypeptidase-like regulatory domain-containing protein [Agrococcus citreus]
MGVERTSQNQHVAANLAAEEIDLVHDAADLFQVQDRTRPVTLNNTVFTITRETEWVSATGADISCGTGSESLSYKRVNVTVSWAGADPVRADTILDSPERLNDSTKGTVLVSVVDSLGNGVSGVSVSLTPRVAGSPIAATATDSFGCAFFLQVTKGTYDMAIAKLGYVGVFEKDPIRTGVVVDRGSAESYQFQYDQAGRLDASLAPAPASLPRGTTITIPPSLQATISSTYGPRLVTPTRITSAQPLEVHPRIPYRVFAGSYSTVTTASCLSVDPTEWPEALVGGVQLAAGASEEVSVAPGARVPLSVPMGLVRVESGVNDLRIRRADGRAGDPQCASHPEFVFNSRVDAGTVIALPFGAWRFTRTGSSATAVNVGIITGGAYISERNIVTLDPRQPVTP